MASNYNESLKLRPNLVKMVNLDPIFTVELNNLFRKYMQVCKIKFHLYIINNLFII